ncbi:hypothetical protein DUNSADRAFT_8582 [Dunaliella salina]|uniref:Uncharacterized protein n=1 Tax=Dunaliella salina TaxID=3046 RepID=A0ABQ7GJ75_DUNSA|nr:hypothetical protein DUNSADRAFT_8582 [Dunaliella salina]|eukprot:KAF5834658.1 hypothetical protein DUNSADRAFT_8582 [Dunaliella salina]
MAHQLRAGRRCSTSGSSSSSGHQSEVYQQGLHKAQRQQHNHAFQQLDQPLQPLSLQQSPTTALPTFPHALSCVWASLFQTAADPCMFALAAVTAAVGSSPSSHSTEPTAQPTDTPWVFPTHLGAASWLAALPLMTLCYSTAKRAWAMLGVIAVFRRVPAAGQSQQQEQQQQQQQRQQQAQTQAQTQQQQLCTHSWPRRCLKPPLDCVLLMASVAALAAFLLWLVAASMEDVFLRDGVAIWEAALSVLGWHLSSSPGLHGSAVSSKGSKGSAFLLDSACQILQSGGVQLPRVCSSSTSSTSSASSSRNASVPPQSDFPAPSSPMLGLLPLLPLDALFTFPVLATTLLLLTHSLLGLLGAMLRTFARCLDFLLQKMWRLANAGILAAIALLRRQRCGAVLVRKECGTAAKTSDGVGDGKVTADSSFFERGSPTNSNAPRVTRLPHASFGLGSSAAPATEQVAIPTPRLLTLTALCLAVIAASILHLALGLFLATVLVLIPAYLLNPASDTQQQHSTEDAAPPPPSLPSPPQFPLPENNLLPSPAVISTQHPARGEPVFQQHNPHLQPTPSTQQPAPTKASDMPSQPALPIQARCGSPAFPTPASIMHPTERAGHSMQGKHPLLQSVWLFMLAGCAVIGPSGLSALTSLLEGGPAFELARADNAGHLAPVSICISAGGRGSAASRQTCPLAAEAAVSAVVALQAAAVVGVSAVAVGAAAALQALVQAKKATRYVMAASAIAALSVPVCLQARGNSNQQVVQGIRACGSQWLSLAAFMLAAGATATALMSICAQMHTYKPRSGAGHPRGRRALLKSAVSMCTAAAAAAAAAAHCLPLVVEHAKWLLPLLLQGKGVGDVLWAAEADGAQQPGALGWWYVWGADVALLLPACLGPLALAAVCVGLCNSGGPQHLQHLDRGEGHLATSSGAASAAYALGRKREVQGGDGGGCMGGIDDRKTSEGEGGCKGGLDDRKTSEDEGGYRGGLVDRDTSEGSRRDPKSGLERGFAEQRSSSVEQGSSNAALPGAAATCHEQCQQCESCRIAQKQQAAHEGQHRSRASKNSSSSSSSSKGVHVMKPIGCRQQGRWKGCWGLDSWLSVLLRICACAAFGGAALGLDFAPYVTQAATGSFLLAWAGGRLVSQI